MLVDEIRYKYIETGPFSKENIGDSGDRFECTENNPIGESGVNWCPSWNHNKSKDLDYVDGNNDDKCVKYTFPYYYSLVNVPKTYQETIRPIVPFDAKKYLRSKFNMKEITWLLDIQFIY